MEHREARHQRQRRRQRGNARVSDLVVCEPRNPHCNSDPERVRRPTSDRAPARQCTRRELPPNRRCASPTNRSPQRARVAVPQRKSVVRRDIIGSAAASAITIPESPIWLPASRAILTSAPTLKEPAAQHPTARPHANAHGASCRRTTDARAPTRTRGRTVEIEHREARHLRQRRRKRRDARVSDLVVCEPRNPHCRSDPKRPAAHHPTARSNAEARGASCRPTEDARAPTTGNPQRSRVAVPLRSSVVRLGICGSAAASAVTPESLIQQPANRASLTAAQTTKARRQTIRPRVRTPKHTARAVAHPKMREPKLQETRNAHAWSYG
jgi:hypothetical protein